jgi:uncharacterized protein (DUF608 family)
MKKSNSSKSRRDFLKNSAAAGVLIGMPFGVAAKNEVMLSNENIRLDRYKAGIKTRELGEHEYNGSYSGEFLNRVAFPIGGIGAGMFCMEGTGAISHVSVKNSPAIFNEAFSFAAISIKGVKDGAKVLEAPVPEWKLFGRPGAGNGLGDANYGFPRFESGNFLPRFPFGTLELKDKDIPLKIHITGWSPFIPTDEDNSSLPVGTMEYHFKNTTDKKLEAVFSYNTRNFVDSQGLIMKAKNGFKLVESPEEYKKNPNAGFIIYVDNDESVVDYCWFRGGWFDSKTILWKNIEDMSLKDNPPIDEPAPGASIYVPVSLNPGEEKTIKVNYCWYFPDTKLKLGRTPDEKEADNSEESGPFYEPWYASKFKNVEEVVDYWNRHSKELKKRSEEFRDAFYSSTLPDEVIEAVAANLTILKSPTVLRQSDGRFWAFEGCSDDRGCCHGSCTHVWNYAQALPHLFPALERTLRETEFKVNQNREGHQTFRANLPISEPTHDFHAAADGQLGGIMKMYRDWRISGDNEWMAELYPLVKQSLDYCIKEWDPKHKGYLEEPHHNTYDIEFWGPDGMCTSFYLGALTAFIEMSKALNKSYDFYETLLSKGREYMEDELFNGEYFIQKVKWTGLEAPDPVEAMSMRTNYSPEALEILKKEGPKYQYGSGCLSDGVLGMWIALVCGLDEVLDEEKIKSHLVAIHKYNLKPILMDHINPQRPTFACCEDGGLLLCSWPKGGELSLPFVYSDEVWTGIEYQVASHLMFKGEVEKGLEIVRICRDRYDGTNRNPFDEIECGHWYARAMASYGMLQSLTGVWYDAVDRTLTIDSKVGDFKSFISTETGFGNVGLKNGEPFVDIVFGDIDIKKVVVSGTEKRLL